MVDLVLFLTEAGAAVAPGPFLATAALFAPLLEAAGHPGAADASSGAITGTVALGDASQVVDLDLVDRLAIVLPGPSLAVIGADEVAARRIETMDLARGVFDVDVPAGLTGEPIDPDALERAIGRMTLAVAAEMIGVARWLQEASVSYAGERVQFGKPIGSFQGLQYRMVDAALIYERAAAAVSYAAMCVDADDSDRERAIHVAKAEAGLAARGWAKDGMQVHGGIGYTWEHDLHLRLRRAYADDALLGTTTWHHDQLADLLFGT
jgi:alkylation response protein AidB-like acyl-CoA dehydrogenase